MLLRFAEKNPGMTRVLIGDALVNEDERLQARINQFIRPARGGDAPVAAHRAGGQRVARRRRTPTPRVLIAYVDRPLAAVRQERLQAPAAGRLGPAAQVPVRLTRARRGVDSRLVSAESSSCSAASACRSRRSWRCSSRSVHVPRTRSRRPAARPRRDGQPLDRRRAGAPCRRAGRDLARLDEEVRLKLLSPSTRVAQLDARRRSTTATSRRRSAHFAARASPRRSEKLYLASLAVACLQRDAAGAARVRLGRSGSPTGRARRRQRRAATSARRRARAQRGDSDKMLAHLDAGGRQGTLRRVLRARGVVTVWDWRQGWRASPTIRRPRRCAAVDYAGDQPLVWPTALAGRAARTRASRRQTRCAPACARVGRALAERARRGAAALIGIAVRDAARHRTPRHASRSTSGAARSTACAPAATMRGARASRRSSPPIPRDASPRSRRPRRGCARRRRSARSRRASVIVAARPRCAPRRRVRATVRARRASSGGLHRRRRDHAARDAPRRRASRCIV